MSQISRRGKLQYAILSQPIPILPPSRFAASLLARLPVPCRRSGRVAFAANRWQRRNQPQRRDTQLDRQHDLDQRVQRGQGSRRWPADPYRNGLGSKLRKRCRGAGEIRLSRSEPDVRIGSRWRTTFMDAEHFACEIASVLSGNGKLWQSGRAVFKHRKRRSAESLSQSNSAGLDIVATRQLTIEAGKSLATFE